MIRHESGVYAARCADYAHLEGRGPTESLALEKLRAAILFDLEMCPCDVTTADGLELQVVERG